MLPDSGSHWGWGTGQWAVMRTRTQAAEEHNGTRKSSRIKKTQSWTTILLHNMESLLSCWVSSWKSVKFPRKEKTVRVGTRQEASWLRQQTGWLSGSTWFILFIFSVVAHYPSSLNSSPYQLMAQLITLSRVMSVVIGKSALFWWRFYLQFSIRPLKNGENPKQSYHIWK